MIPMLLSATLMVSVLVLLGWLSVMSLSQPSGAGGRGRGPRGRSGQLLHNLGITRVESDGIGTGGNRIDVMVIKVKVQPLCWC